MATTTSITTTYSGEFAGKYIGSALLSANSLNNGSITVKPNVKYKQVLKTVSLGNDVVRDATCDFTDTSSIALNERVLEPKELQVNLDTCKKNYTNDWEAIQMGFSAFDKLPKNFSDFLIARVLESIAEKTEQDIWNGDSTTNGSFDGFETLIAADANLPSAQEVTGTTVDASNVIDELGKIVDAAPTRLRVRPDIKLNVAPNIYFAYVRALGGFAANGVGGAGTDNKGTQWYNGGALTFDGIPVVICNGMSSNVAILTYTENLYFGTGLLSDHNQVQVIDMADVDGSKNVRFVARYTAGVNYSFAGDIVTYGISNTVN